MKTTILTIISAALLSLMAQAAPAEISSFKKATLNVCYEDVVDCVHSININGQTFPMTVDAQAPEAESIVSSLIENCHFHKLPNTAPFLVKGYFTFKGFFPNPMHEQLVFVITDVDAVILHR